MQMIRFGLIALVAIVLVATGLGGPTVKADGGGGIVPPGKEDSTDVVIQEPDSTSTSPDTVEETSSTSLWYWLLQAII